MSGDTLPFPGGDVPRPFGVPAVAGPESAAEHLRNALMLIDAARAVDANPAGMIRIDAWRLDVDAVRRRVAVALTQLEGK